MYRSETASGNHDARLTFLKGFLRRPRDVGSIIPSSRFLERLIVAQAEVHRARSVVELGPGTGGTTRALLRALPAGASLLALELDREFAATVAAANPDPRLFVECGSAEHLEQALARHQLVRPQAVVSGIPFSTMPPELGRRVLEAVRETLAPGGVFVAYQVRDTVAQLAAPLFGEPEVRWSLLNVPPLRVFRWRVPGGGRAPG